MADLHVLVQIILAPKGKAKGSFKIAGAQNLKKWSQYNTELIILGFICVFC